MQTQRLASWLKRLGYPARTTVAAVVGALAAKALGLPEFYWAPISALIAVQSDFGSSLRVSWQRFAGTALGVSLAALLAENVGRGMVVFVVGVFGVGLLSVALRLDRPANRFAAIAFCIVFLLQRHDPAWVVALHRFIEVSTGIVAGLLVTAVWPEQKTADSPARPMTDSRSTNAKNTPSS